MKTVDFLFSCNFHLCCQMPFSQSWWRQGKGAAVILYWPYFLILFMISGPNQNISVTLSLEGWLRLLVVVCLGLPLGITWRHDWMGPLVLQRMILRALEGHMSGPSERTDWTMEKSWWGNWGDSLEHFWWEMNRLKEAHCPPVDLSAVGHRCSAHAQNIDESQQLRRPHTQWKPGVTDPSLRGNVLNSSCIWQNSPNSMHQHPLEAQSCVISHTEILWSSARPILLLSHPPETEGWLWVRIRPSHCSFSTLCLGKGRLCRVCMG